MSGEYGRGGGYDFDTIVYECSSINYTNLKFTNEEDTIVTFKVPPNLH